MLRTRGGRRAGGAKFEKPKIWKGGPKSGEKNRIQQAPEALERGRKNPGGGRKGPGKKRGREQNIRSARVK